MGVRRILVCILCALAGCSGGSLSADALVLPPAFVGETYVGVLSARGGEPPYAWTISSGQLPVGLQLEPTGAVFGVAQQAGEFPIEFTVRDATASEARAMLLLRVRGSSAPTSCEAPATLSLVGGSARISGRFPGEVSSSPERPCRQDGGVARVYYRIEIPAQRRLTVAVTSDQPAQVTVLEASCPAEIPVSTCGNDLQVDAPAGSYLIEAIGQPDATLELSVDLSPGVDIGSCGRPAMLDVSTQVARLAGRVAASAPSELNCSQFDEAYVYSFELEEEQDVRIDVGFVSYGLFADTCFGPEVVPCRSSGPSVLPNVPAGRYLLVLSGSPGSSFEGALEIMAPSARPMNDQCELAQPVSFSGDTLVLTGSTLGAVQDGNPACGFEDFSLYYEINLDERSWLNVAPADDLDVSVLSSCADSLHCGVTGRCTPALESGQYLLKVGRRLDERHLPFAVEIKRTPVELPANDECSQPELLPSSVGRHVVAGTVRNANASLGSSCSSGTGEVFYALDLTERSDVVLRFRNEGSLAPRLAYVGADCAAFEGECLEYGRLLGLQPGRHLFSVESGYGVGESVECRNGDPAEFELMVEIAPSPPPPANDECSGLTTITLPTGGATISVDGTLKGATDDENEMRCPDFGSVSEGPEVHYALETSDPGRLRVQGPPGLQLSLHSLACTESAALACERNTGLLAPGFGLLPGTYFLRVSQPGVARGDDPVDFSLQLQWLAP